MKANSINFRCLLVLVCSNIIFEAFVNICQVWQHTPVAGVAFGNVFPPILPAHHQSTSIHIHPSDDIDSSRPFRLHAKLITCTNNNWAEVLIVAKGQTDEPQGCIHTFQCPPWHRRTARTSRTHSSNGRIWCVCASWQVKTFAIACHLRTGPQPEDTPDHRVDHQPEA